MFALIIWRNNLRTFFFDFFRFLLHYQGRFVCGNRPVYVRIAASFAIFGALGLDLPVQAELDHELEESGWSEFTFEGKQANRFFYPAGNTDVIQVDTDSSVSIAYLPFSDQPVSLKRTPYLNFSWRRLGEAPDTDLTKKGGDDRTLSVYVAFPYEPNRASLKEKLLRPFVESREGPDAPGRLLTYLWGGGEKPGVWFENPYTGEAGWMQILQTPSDSQGIWFSHKIDIQSDFIGRFGYAPSDPSYIAIAADSDDTGSRFSAQIRDLSFSN